MKPVDCGRCATPHSASAHVCPKCGLRAGTKRGSEERHRERSSAHRCEGERKGKDRSQSRRAAAVAQRRARTSVGSTCRAGPRRARSERGDHRAVGLREPRVVRHLVGLRRVVRSGHRCSASAFLQPGAGAITAIDCGDTFVVAVSSAGSVIVIRDSDVLIVEGRMPPTHVAAARVAPRFAVARGRSVTVFEAKSAVRALHTWECVDVSI